MNEKKRKTPQEVIDGLDRCAMEGNGCKGCPYLDPSDPVGCEGNGSGILRDAADLLRAAYNREREL